MRADRQDARSRRGRRPPRPDPEVVFVPPATPEAEADAWRRWVETMEWIVTLGAMDA